MPSVSRLPIVTYSCQRDSHALPGEDGPATPAGLPARLRPPTSSPQGVGNDGDQLPGHALVARVDSRPPPGECLGPARGAPPPVPALPAIRDGAGQAQAEFDGQARKGPGHTSSARLDGRPFGDP